MAATDKKQHNPKAWFCASLPWDIKLDWFDRSGTHALDDRRVAIVELDTYDTHDHYPGFKVRIVDKLKGPIDSKYFKFDDYLPRDLTARTDGRADYPVSPRNPCFEVIAYCDWRWYIAVPKDARPFCEAVERWISTWRM